MELVNSTPLTARIDVAHTEELGYRVGMIVAKATFRFDMDGSVTLDADDPYPIFLHDVESELGLLPRDDFPRIDDAFEVILLGVAYAPEGKPVRSMKVGLQVGDERRELIVFGDREWMDVQGNKAISEPEYFEKMPLTYENAFGGTCDIFVDKDSPVEVSDPFNKYGKGMDPAPIAKELGKTFKCPDGYPFYDTRRELPNLEDPENLITDWSHKPMPKCWATVPLDSGIHGIRSVVIPEEAGTSDLTLTLQEGVFHRAHPDWVISVPPEKAEVVLDGLTPRGIISFNLPALRVFADYVIGSRTGTRELAPQMLVLLPEEERFYLVYRHVFPFDPIPGEERSMRLRIENGWYK